MTIKVEGNYPEQDRIETGLYTFDLALSNRRTGQLGYPTKSVIEIYGSQGVGKSTMSYFLAGKRSVTGRVLLCDLEGLDVDYLPVAMEQSGFDGTVEVVNSVDNKGKMRSHESMINEMTDRTLYDEDVNAGILDSVGAILPTFESASEIGEGFGAKRAVIVAQFARKAAYAVNNKLTKPNIFVINHSHMIVSGGMGHQSAGGVVLGYLGIVKIFLRYATKDFIKTADDVLAFVLEGTVEKLRYGGKCRQFKGAYVPGYGIRPNLTALIDCVNLGLAERGTTVKIGDKSLGFISKFVEQDLAGNNEAFVPFYELLEKEKKSSGH